MSNAILYRMAQGIPGDVSRASVSTIESQPLASGTPFPGYGLPGKISGGAFVPVSAVGDTAPYGLLVRPFPTTGPDASDPLGTAVPPTTGVANILRRGYMTVKCNAGTPALGGAVYIRYANGVTATPVGGIEAAAVASTTVALTNAIFTGAADANGNVEIAFNI